MAAPRDVAIVGVGQTDFSALYAQRDDQRDAYALAAEALALALEDAGLRKDDLDGLLCSRIHYGRMADVAGLRRLRVVNTYEGSGRMSGVAVQHAASLVRNGRADVVALVYGNNGRSVQMRYGGEGSGSNPMTAYDSMYGMTSPGAYVALMYERYRQLYGAPDGALAPIAINNRANAALNPVAVMKQPITEDVYLGARYIAEPLRLYDYCIINDGGVALVLTTTDRARDLAKPSVRIAAMGSSSDLTNSYTSTDFFGQACADTADELRRHGFGPDDVDCLQIYDNFTPVVLFSLEGFGFCKPGEAWDWVRGGRITLEGDMPVNTAGGHTGESYMQGWGHHVEAVRQVRGEAGERQVHECATVQYICASPIVTSHILTSN